MRNLTDCSALTYQRGGSSFRNWTEAQMSSKQYREFATECLRWAEESTSEADRRHFIDMAKAWVQAAAELRELDHHVESTPSPRPARRRKGGDWWNVGPNT